MTWVNFVSSLFCNRSGLGVYVVGPCFCRLFPTLGKHLHVVIIIGVTNMCALPQFVLIGQAGLGGILLCCVSKSVCVSWLGRCVGGDHCQFQQDEELDFWPQNGGASHENLKACGGKRFRFMNNCVRYMSNVEKQSVGRISVFSFALWSWSCIVYM